MAPTMTSFASQGLLKRLHFRPKGGCGLPKWLHFGSKARPKEAWILTRRKRSQNREMIHEKPQLVGPILIHVFNDFQDTFRACFCIDFGSDFGVILGA